MRIRGVITRSAVGLLFLSLVPLHASYYFDLNGPNGGSGVVTGAHPWTGTTWSANSAGTTSTLALPSRNTAILSAGVDGFGSTLTLTGASGEMGSVIVEEGHVVIQTLTRIFKNGSVIQTRPGTSLVIQNSPDFYNNTVTLDSAAGTTITLAGANSGGSRNAKLVKTGPGLVIFQGQNVGMSGGTLTIHEGEYRILNSSSVANGAAVVNAGGSLSLAGTISPARALTLRGEGHEGFGALRSVSGSNSWNGLVTLGSDARISADAGASLTLAPASGDALTGAYTLTLGGAGTLSVSRPISGVTSLVKDGTGALSLAAANTFPGPTIVSGGTLRFRETSGVLGGLSGPLVINSTVEIANAAAQNWNTPISGAGAGRLVKQGTGRLTVSGTHSFSGTVSIQSGTLALAAGAGLPGVSRFELLPSTALDVSGVMGFSVGAGQSLSGSGLVIGPITFAQGSEFEFGTGTPTSVTGSVAFAAASTVRLPETLPNGSHPLLHATGGISGVANIAAVGFTSLTKVVSLQLNAAGTELSAVVSTNPYSGRNLTWSGVGNLWDAGTSDNWLAGALPAVFAKPDAVLFDDTGAANPVVSLIGTLIPASVTVSSAGDYTFLGAGSLAGPMGLTKSGGGRLVLNGPHAFTGSTTITGGILEVRDSGALGGGGVNNAGTLKLAPDAGETLRFSNPISGSGGVSVSNGLVTLTGSNGFTGSLTLSSGTLGVGHVSALGATSGGTIVSAGAVLDFAGFAVGAEPVTLSGGTLRNSANSTASLAGPLTVTDNSTIDAPGGLVLSGTLGGNGSLTITSGQVSLASASQANITMIVAPGATLDGEGSVGGSLSIQGELAPDGLVSFQQLELGPTAVTTLRIEKTGGNVVHSGIAVSGTFVRAGRLVVEVGGEPLSAGDSIQLLSAGEFVGDFSSIQLPYLSGDLLWDRSDLSSAGVLRVITLPAVSTMAQRRDWLLTRLADDPGGVDGFTAAAGFFARGDIEVGRSSALSRSRSLLANHLDGAVQVDLFYIWPAVDLVARYGQHLDEETKANIRQVVLTFNQYKDTTTSNLKTLSWVTRFLGGELYGEAAFDAAVDVNGVPVTNDWRAADPNARDTILGHLNTVVSSGFGEIASRPYLWKNLLPLLSLGQLAQDPTVRQRSALTYEAGLAQHAGYWLRGHLAMPTSRSYPDMLEQSPSSGASIGMFWVHFGGELPALDSDSALLTAVMNPSVSPVLELAAASRETPFFSRSRNAANYLQAYLERDYALFADGPVGPNSGQVYANGVVWTDSDRSRYSHLWVAKPIHDDPSSINVSNTHGKESRQFAETVARDALLYSFDIAPPADLTITPTPTPYGMGYVPGGYRAVVNEAASTGQIFLHYGSVLIAIRSEIPFGWNPATPITYPSGAPRAGDSEFLIDGDTNTTRPPATFVSPLTTNLRFAVAIETARPTDFPGATPADQLAAFRTAILALPKPSRPADAPTTAVYTTRRGDRLRLTRSQDVTTYPVTVNDAPVEYALFPRIENPWIYQPANSTTLVLRSPDRRETLDLSGWTRTTATGSIDVTPPVISNVPANRTISATHPQPTVTYSASAIDAVDGSVPVTFFPLSGSAFPPGTTSVVTATAADANLNTTTATFTVTVLPYPSPPAPATPWSVQNIGTQPTTLGTAQHDVTNRVMLVAGTGGTAGTGTSGDIWSGSSEGFTYVSRPWSGDGVFTARVWSFVATDTGAKAGIMVRETPATGSKNTIMYLTEGGSAIFQNKTTTGGNAATSTSTGRGFPEWIRLVRSGNTFTGYFSNDGVAWSQQGTTVTNTMSGSALTVGLAVAPRTGGQTGSVIFDNLTFHSPLDLWRLSTFGTDLAVGSAADQFDADGDGLSNLIEYALGTTPTDSLSGSTPVPQISGLSLQISFLRARSDLTYSVEGSSDLSPNSWQTIVTNPGTVGQHVTVNDPEPANSRRFLRLRVTSP